MRPTASTDFYGRLETHITVRCADIAIPALVTWGREHEMKCTHIVLDRGNSASQPMLTRHARGTLSAERAAAAKFARDIQADGYQVVRIKIEAVPDNAGVPQEDSDAPDHGPERYFEHHVKLVLAVDADLALLAKLVERHGARLSRNALRVRPDNLAERFVTQRCHGVGRKSARRQLDELLVDLASIGYRPIEIDEEFVIYDSNLALDAGWIEG